MNKQEDLPTLRYEEICTHTHRHSDTYIHIHTYLCIIYDNLRGFPHSSAGKESAYDVGDLDLIPGLGRSPGEGKGYTFQYSGVAKSWTRLSEFQMTKYQNDCLLR